jgi:hypothetical protein
LSLLDSAGNPVSQALAQMLAQAFDDLSYIEPVKELSPPRANYFELGGQSNAKRQARGKFSWAAFVVPEDPDMLRYQVFVVVFAQRPNDPLEDAFRVVSPAPNRDAQPRPVMYGGGDVTLDQLAPSSPVPVDIRRGEFLAMFNLFAGRVQFEIFRIVELRGRNAADPANVDLGLTLQGSDFDFVPDWDGSTAAPTGIPTYAVRMPAVIAVYSRTMQLEASSNYN